MPDKAALVVGGTRRIGRWVSEALAVSGYGVTAVFKQDVQSARSFQDEMAAAGNSLGLIQADASDPARAKEAVDEAATNAGQLDVLVVCCGPSIRGSIIATAPEDLERIWKYNVLAVHNCVTAATPYLRQRDGRIICFLSAGTDSIKSFSEIPVYAAAKTMLASYLRSLAKELSGSGITVNALAPGITELPGEGAPGVEEKKLEAGQIINQEDIAAAVWYLVGPASAKVTGTVLNIGGGFGI